MGAAAGSALCCCTVLKTTLAYHNHGMIEDFYGINLRHLLRMAEQYYGNEDLTIWMPHTDATRGPYTDGMLHRCAVMHKAITILMLKLECEVIDRTSRCRGGIFCAALITKLERWIILARSIPCGTAASPR